MKTVNTIIVLIGILLVVAIVVPRWVKGRTHTATSACVANLLQIEEAKRTWVEEYHKKVGDFPSDADLFGEGRYIKSKPPCPGGGVYALGAVGEKPTCSIGPPSHTLDHKKYE